MFWGKIFNIKEEIVVAICDEELVDKTIKMKDVDINISRNFYGGRLIDESLAVKIMKTATIGNLMGKDIVKLAENNGFVSKENVIMIEGVPHAQFVVLT